MQRGLCRLRQFIITIHKNAYHFQEQPLMLYFCLYQKYLNQHLNPTRLSLNYGEYLQYPETAGWLDRMVSFFVNKHELRVIVNHFCVGHLGWHQIPEGDEQLHVDQFYQGVRKR